MDFLENELYHHGIKGQRWGIRRFQNEDGSLTSAGRKRYEVGDKMDANDPNDSSVTRKVKRNYNEMTDKEFMNRYKVSKKTYMKRVNKYGDPYMNSPLAKMGKKLTEQKQEKRKRAVESIQKDIDYFSENKNGIYFNNGKLMLSKQEISDILKELEKQKDKAVSDIAKVDKFEFG